MTTRLPAVLVSLLLSMALNNFNSFFDTDELFDDTDRTAFALEMTEVVNEARKTGRVCGETFYDPAPPLTWNMRLADAAHIHAVDMAANNHFDHAGTDGSTPGSRIRRQGYTPKAWGENIAAGFIDVQAVVDNWLESPGHCANIMSPDYSEIGASSAENTYSQYSIFWAQVFAAPNQ